MLWYSRLLASAGLPYGLGRSDEESLGRSDAHHAPPTPHQMINIFFVKSISYTTFSSYCIQSAQLLVGVFNAHVDLLFGINPLSARSNYHGQSRPESRLEYLLVN